MFLTTRVIVLHHFPYLGPADKGLLYTFPTSKWLFSCARAPTRGTSWAESGILFYEPDVLHSSYPAMSSQILFTTTTYGCLHVERINYSLSLLSHLYLTKTNAGSKLLIWSMLKQFGQVIRPSTDGTWANSFMGYLTTNYFCETSVDQSWNL